MKTVRNTKISQKIIFVGLGCLLYALLFYGVWADLIRPNRGLAGQQPQGFHLSAVFIITLMLTLVLFSIGLVVLACVEDYRGIQQRISGHYGGGVMYITPGDILHFFLAILVIGVVWGSLAAALTGYLAEFSMPFVILVVMIGGGLLVANLVLLIRDKGISSTGKIWRIVLTIPYVIFPSVWVVVIGHATFIYFTNPFESPWIQLGISIVNLLCIVGILALSIISVQALAEGSNKQV